MKLIRYINIDSNVSIEFFDGFYVFSGPKGKINFNVHKFLNLNINNSVLCLSVNDFVFKRRELSFLPAIFNTNFVMLKNCLYGVVNLFEYFLVLRGVGYKVSYDDKLSTLTFLLGYSHPVKLSVPSDISIDIPSNSEVIVKSVSKVKAGQFAAEIRSIKLPDIYKGNGIRYKDENIILKVPKKAK